MQMLCLAKQERKKAVKVSSRSSKKSANICYCTVIVSVCIFAWNTALATLQEVWSSRLDKCSTHVIAMKSSTALSVVVVVVQQLAAQALCRRQLRPQPSPPLSRDWRRRRRFRCLFLPHPYTLDLLGDTAAFTLLQRPQSRLCRTTINTLLQRRDKLLLAFTCIKTTYPHVCLSGWPFKKNGQVVKWPSTAQRGLHMGSFAVATLNVFAHNLHNWCLVSNGLLGFYLGFFL